MVSKPKDKIGEWIDCHKAVQRHWFSSKTHTLPLARALRLAKLWASPESTQLANRASEPLEIAAYSWMMAKTILQPKLKLTAILTLSALFFASSSPSADNVESGFSRSLICSFWAV
jgi:hypothetical protein